MAKANVNVKVALVYTLAVSAASGIWSYSVLSGYLQGLGGSNFKVGLAEGIQGAAQALAAIPAGVGADRSRRDRVLKFAAGLGTLAFAAMLASLLLGARMGSEYASVCVSLGLVGAYNGATNAPLEALFADSTTTSERPRLTTYKFVCRILGSATGPLTALVLFQVVGDTWTLGEQRTVMVIGCACSAFPALLLLLFSDRGALGEAAESVTVGCPAVTSPDMRHAAPLLDLPAPGHDERSADCNLDATAARRRARLVPFVCAGSDIIFGLASGASVPVFAPASLLSRAVVLTHPPAPSSPLQIDDDQILPAVL